MPCTMTNDKVLGLTRSRSAKEVQHPALYGFPVLSQGNQAAKNNLCTRGTDCDIGWRVANMHELNPTPSLAFGVAAALQLSDGTNLRRITVNAMHQINATLPIVANAVLYSIISPLLRTTTKQRWEKLADHEKTDRRRRNEQIQW